MQGEEQLAQSRRKVSRMAQEQLEEGGKQVPCTLQGKRQVGP